MTKISRRAAAAGRLARRGGRAEDGFTVIELLIVLLILVVLVAVGIPTYFNIRNELTDNHAQASINKVLAAAHVYESEEDLSYAGMCLTKDCSGNSGGLLAQKPGVTLIHNGISTNPGVVSIDVVNNGSDVIAASFANGTGNCWAAISTTEPGDQMDSESSQFIGVFDAVDPASQIKKGPCYAGLFDTANLIGEPPVIAPNWPAT
jgi:prepilin-type N-terminal cleavage/methylation domain-containing protein